MREYQLAAKTYALSSNFAEALNSLYLSEDLLEAVSAQSLPSDSCFATCTFHNLAFCHSKYPLHRLNEAEKSVPLLEKAIRSFERTEIYMDRPAMKVKPLKYSIRGYLNISHLYSRLGDSEASVKSARNSFAKCKELIQLCAEACEDHLSRHTQFNRSPRLKHRIKAQRQYNLMSLSLIHI